MTAANNRSLQNSQAVLFDLDGTLLDTAQDLIAVLNQVCDEEQHPSPDPDFAARHVSTGAVGLIRLAFPDHDEDAIERLRKRLISVYEQQLCVHTVAYPGMLKVLDQLEDSGIAWGVVTNKMKYLAEPILDELELLSRCATLVGGDTASANKPHPAPIQLALKEMQIAPERAFYVGDAEKDIIAGRAAGTGTIAVTWGYTLPGDDPYRWNADFTIANPAELLKI